MASTSKGCKVQRSLVEQFCAVTGADDAVARCMLEACNGNLEMAINMHVDTQSNVADVPASVPSQPVGDDVRPPIPPVQGVLVEEGFGYGFHGRKRVVRSVFDGFRDFQAETRWQEEELAKSGNLQSYKKKKTLEDLFRPPLDLIYRGSFETAREVGQSSNRWLMINVQNVQEFACQVLNRDVWSNPAVKGIVSEHFIFWQIYNDSEEGIRYCQFYKVLDFPYVAILDPRTGENLVVWNNIDSVSFCDLVTDFISEHPTPDGSVSSPPKKKVRVETIVDESEESQLKAAIEASLKDTKETTAAASSNTSEIDVCNSASNSTTSDLETFESDSENLDDDSVTNSSRKGVNNGMMGKDENCLNQGKKMNATKIRENSHQAEVTWKQFSGNENDAKSELMIRYPDGERELMCFPCSSRLQALLLYVESRGYDSEAYELVTNFPRRNLNVLDKHITLQEARLFPRETIFVQLKNS